jgi:predicted TIM-barrel fold metal-dependent hydrolase
MTMGPGKYDEEATMVMESTKAHGVIVIVIGGDRGPGFAIQATLDVTMALPAMLRDIANQIEADTAHMGT